MKKVYFRTLILSSLICGFLVGCGDDEAGPSSANTGGGANNGVLDPSTPTGVITHRDFSINFNPGSAEVFSSTGGYNGSIEVAVIISASDIHDLIVSGQTVKFRTEWGTFPEGDTCVLTDGQCSIKWLPGDAYTAPSAIFPATTPPESQECQVAFTAWTIGEEKFSDANDNGLFDAGEDFLDLPEPYLDINETGLWSNVSTGYVTGWDAPGFCNSDGVCELIDINNDGSHNSSDGLYNGSLCASNNSAQCSTATSTVIWTTSYLFITNPTTPHTCDSFKPTAP